VQIALTIAPGAFKSNEIAVSHVAQVVLHLGNCVNDSFSLPTTSNHPYLPPPSTVVRRSHPLWLPVSTTIGSSPSLASASIGPSSRLRSTHRCLLRKRGFSSELLASFALRDRFKVLLQYVPFCLGFHASVLKLIGALNSSFDKSAVIGFKI